MSRILSSGLKSILDQLIAEELAKVINEQKNEPPAEDTSAPPPAEDTSTPAPDASTGGDMGDMGGDIGGDMGGPPEAGGADSGGGGGMDTGEGMTDDTTGMDDGGGMDGGGGMGALDFSLGGGGGGGGGGGMDTGGGEPGEDGSGTPPGLTPPEEPPKDPSDPVGAAYSEAEKFASKTTDIQQIENAVKASIQVNFSSYEDAWPLVQKLRDSGDKTLSAVADRMSLFIAGIQESKKMKIKEMGFVAEKKPKVVWIKNYGSCSIRKIIRYTTPGHYGRPDVQYDVSMSPNRTSWYRGFQELNDAKRFASLPAPRNRPSHTNYPDIKVREQKTPKTMKLTKEHLKVIVHEAMAASSRDPGDPHGRDVDWTTYQEVLEIFEQLSDKIKSIDPKRLTNVMKHDIKLYADIKIKRAVEHMLSGKLINDVDEDDHDK